VTPITFTLTLDDMLAANRLAMQRYVRKGLPKFSLAVVVTALVVTLIAYAFNPKPMAVAGALFARIVALYVGVAAVGVAYVLFVAPRLRAKKNMAQMPALSRAQTMEWDETTITFSSDTGHMTVPLTDVHQWAANETVLILYPADHLFYCIPRQYVTDKTSWDRLITAIRRAGITSI
jgi:hypothetical protein